MNRVQNNLLVQQYNRINSMNSIQNNPILAQVNRKNQQPQKINDPTRIREAILDQRKPDQKMDVNKFNRVYSILDGVRSNEKEKLWAGRTNQPYKNIFPSESIKKEYRTKEELVMYTVKKEDKDEKKFKENVDKLKSKITEHDRELKNVFDPVRKKNYEEQFEYNNRLKYKIKYDPANFDEMKSDITEYYKKEQEEEEKNKKRADDIIESIVGLNFADSGDASIDITCKQTTENTNTTISGDKYLQRQKKI